VAPLWLRVAGGQTASGCLFRTLFLWLLSFGVAKESDSNTHIAFENFIQAKGCLFEAPSSLAGNTKLLLYIEFD
jgi:hypothetical protein